jgi:epoxyqueuosine reductase
MASYLASLTERRRHPVLLSPARDGADPFRSLIVLGAHYHAGLVAGEDPPPAWGVLSDEFAYADDPSRARFAAYAWGDDYHERLRRQLYALDGALRSWSGRSDYGKGLVDTGPVLERDWAAKAGVGFFGKNCCIIHPVYGSWLFLGTLLVPEVLLYDEAPPLHDPAQEPGVEAVWHGLPREGEYGVWAIPLEATPGAADAGETLRTATCGRCTRCLDACPTQAFTGPFHLDPQRCISYWTIETQEPIPLALRPLFGNRIFGCDICQEVCPWNHRLPAERHVHAGFAPQAGHVAPPLLEGFHPATPYWLDDAEFERRFRDAPVKRATRAGMLRNVCVALGNWAAPDAISALALALGDPHPAPRGHAAWALGRLRLRAALAPPGIALELAAATATDLLRDRLSFEDDGWVREEIISALAMGG